ncbi:MAG: calcium-translocating P-type ATPase, PMCA-type [Gammaproteobacteria bacterium]|nr:calcium-translocating P-type ATPase, PMCA-type [Gammaproteobacteria bacterium]
MPQTAWHSLETDEVLQQLASAVSGLSAETATKRLAEHGQNIIPEKQQATLLNIVLRQFTDFMIIVLLLAALISGFIGEAQDSIVILVIVLLNAVIGAVQEFRAEAAVAALRQMAAPKAQVLRDGRTVTLPAAELVPGDIVLLEAGNIVPADLRLLKAEELQADESALTGESQAVEKQTASLAGAELPLGDRDNLVFKSSLITRGRGSGVVIACGPDSEIGKIAEMLQAEARVKTPLQQRLSRFGRYLALAVLAICVIVFSAGLLQGQPALLMFLTAVSLAVAAIPEALPAVVTISLALGARKLIHQNALVRNLPAVETLGSVTYICTDKTGTLTQNHMSVELYYAGGKRLDALPGPRGGEEFAELGMAIAMNNDVVEKDGKPAGEPTELALFEAARLSAFNKTELEQAWPRVAVIPFDSDRKQMTTLHQSDDGVTAYIKGAPERLLQHCAQCLCDNELAAFNAASVMSEVEQLASEGYRVLAFAKREFASLPRSLDAEVIETELTFLGLVALIDPPRPEVPQAVADCLAAGITPVMITGDHAGTAMAIARRLGISDDSHALLTGEKLEKLSDDEFARQVESIRVYARVTPQQKLRIVSALQAKGEFVAMTGDGVNDAPALKRAGIGVAMGKKGTDVAREASDMVLLDDDFSTIVHAVKAGRRIFDNIRKFIKYTMSSNSGEIWTLFLAPFLGLPIPLLPIHILWINLVTDGLPGLALTAEPAESGIMQRAPRPPDENIFAHGMWQHIVWVGLFIGGISIAAMAWAISRDAAYWQTVVFTVLTVSQLFHSLAVRGESQSLFGSGLFSNMPMLGAVLLTLLLQIAVIYLPVFNEIFHTQPLPLFDLAVCLVVSSLVLLAVEFEKWLVRKGLIYVA